MPHVDIELLLTDLDPEQRRAVTAESRLVAVIAGAGSGKTRVLTRRVAYRAATEDADPRHTVVLTFTREAAGELRRRLPRLGLTTPVTAGTFHSVALGLLRQRWADRDERPRAVANDRRRILGQLFGSEGLDELDQEIGWASARGATASTYAVELTRADRRPTMSTSRVAEALDAYAREKRSRGVVDLDDLLALTIEAMRRDAEFAAGVRWRFRHVLVDEAQDLNPLQHRFVDQLREGRDDLFLVGDPSQSIYGFTGSDPAILHDVADHFPGVDVIRLPSNHRSTPQIVAAGGHVLATSGQPAGIDSPRPDGPLPIVEAFDDEPTEAALVAARIGAADPATVGRTAVLARTHATLAPARRALEAAGIAVRASTTGSPTASPIVAEALRKQAAPELRTWLNDLHEEAVEGDGLDERDRAVVAALFDFVREHPMGGGAELRNWLETTDPFGARTPGVELLTFHAAKGREWHTVYVIGCETSLVPHRSATTNAARAEEARLLYVALTRATDQLVVTWARRRGGYRRKRSPLLDGLDLTAPPVSGPPPGLVGMRPEAGADALDRLRAWRSHQARAGGIDPEAIVSDRALAIIAEQRPSSADELDAATGLGPLTSRRLFEGIADALADT